MKFGLKTVLLGTFGGAAFMSGLHRLGPVLPSIEMPAWALLLVGIVMLTFVLCHIVDELHVAANASRKARPISNSTHALKGQP